MSKIELNSTDMRTLLVGLEAIHRSVGVSGHDRIVRQMTPRLFGVDLIVNDEVPVGTSKIDVSDVHLNARIEMMLCEMVRGLTCGACKR